MDEAKTKNIVEYRKGITTNDPDAYAEVALRFEGLTEKRTEELRGMFNKFYKEIEEIMHEETAAQIFEEQPQRKTEMRYGDGKPYIAES